MIRQGKRSFAKILFWGIIPIFVFGLLFIGVSGCGDKKAEQTATESEQLWTCGMHPQVIQNEPGNCPICGMKLTPLKAGTAAAATAGQQEHSEEEHAGMDMGEESQTETGGKQEQTKDNKGKKILYWRAPMDPTYITDAPGKSPMGMDLIPVYEGEEPQSSGSTITIDPAVVQNIGVKVALVEVKTLRREIRTVAHVDYNEKTIYRVNIKFSGWIEKLYVDETGQVVRKGQAMMEIYSPELVATQEEYLLAYQNAQKLKDTPIDDISKSSDNLLAAARQRLLFWDIEQREIDNLEKTGIVKKTLTLYAPNSGIVIAKHVEEGMRVQPGMDLFRIADLSVVWVYAHLFEYEIPWVKVGDEAEMTLPYIPGKVFRGKVKYIYPYLDKRSRDVKVRLEVPNRTLELKPEMYADVKFEQEMSKVTPVIPSEAVLRTGERDLVFIALDGGKFEPREIVLGMEGEGRQYQVLSGLQGGEKVVVSAQFLLDSESRLQEAIQKMLQSKLGKK